MVSSFLFSISVINIIILINFVKYFFENFCFLSNPVSHLSLLVSDIFSPHYRKMDYELVHQSVCTILPSVDQWMHQVIFRIPHADSQNLVIFFFTVFSRKLINSGCDDRTGRLTTILNSSASRRAASR